MKANPTGVGPELPFEVMPLCEEHLGEPAALFGSAYRTAREHEPSLPPCHEDGGSILPKLRGLLRKAPGVAAVRDGRISGFLLGKVLPGYYSSDRTTLLPFPLPEA